LHKNNTNRFTNTPSEGALRACYSQEGNYFCPCWCCHQQVALLCPTFVPRWVSRRGPALNASFLYHPRNPRSLVSKPQLFIQSTLSHGLWTMDSRPGTHPPVCPNPPMPLTVSFNSSTCSHFTCSYREMIICAIRSPEFTTKTCSDRLINNTFTSPR
jgi:hypothetical protein